MKNIIILVLLLLLPNFAFAESTYNEKLIASTVISLIDFTQSDYMFDNDRFIVKEANPLLSENPSDSEMLRFGVVGLGTAYLIGKSELSEWWKHFIIDSALETQKLIIENNQNVIRTGKSAPPLMLVLSWEM